MWASERETFERFIATTCERKPAAEGDTRFEITELCAGAPVGLMEGMEETPIMVESIDDTGTVYATDFFASRNEAWDMIESFRYSQAVPFEVEFAPFGPAWQREQMERGGRVIA